MNIKAFKKLIKEVVVEAIHDELPKILNENKSLMQESHEFNFTSNDVPHSPLPSEIRKQLVEKMGGTFGFTPQSTSNLKVIDEIDTKTGTRVNPYLAFINDSANNMSHQDVAGLRN